MSLNELLLPNPKPWCNISCHNLLVDGQFLLAGTGFIGFTGAIGPSGLQGITGEKGPTGSIGITGTKGIKGDPSGSTGLQGPTGIQGVIGPTGSQGITGDSGSSGDPGGATGQQGITGRQGPTGSRGPTGFIGITGLQGPVGSSSPTGEFSILTFVQNESINVISSEVPCYKIFTNNSVIAEGQNSQYMIIEIPNSSVSFVLDIMYVIFPNEGSTLNKCIGQSIRFAGSREPNQDSIMTISYGGVKNQYALSRSNPVGDIKISGPDFLGIATLTGGSTGIQNFLISGEVTSTSSGLSSFTMVMKNELMVGKLSSGTINIAI